VTNDTEVGSKQQLDSEGMACKELIDYHAKYLAYEPTKRPMLF